MSHLLTQKITINMKKLLLLLVILLVYMANTQAQTKYMLKDKYKGSCGLLQIYQEPSGAIWYDSAVKCSSLVIKTKFGRIIKRQDIPYFYIRYRITADHQIDYHSYQFYYPNRVTKFTMMYWNQTEVHTSDWY